KRGKNTLKTGCFPIYSYNGNFFVNAVTLLEASSNFALSSKLFKVNTIISATSFISSSLNPRVVTAAVPTRTPLVTNGLSLSNGIVFLFVVIPTSSNASSATLPVNPNLETSRSNKWLSEPLDTIRIPPSDNASLKAFVFATICFTYVLKSSDNASLKAVAFAAITCINGPPCTPGNTLLSIALAYSSLQIISPPRGPLNVLCVVVVTKSLYGTGLGCKPAATKPAM